jgi:regulator of nucleoside diphosphate kinase
MANNQNKVILCEEDYRQLKQFEDNTSPAGTDMSLAQELKRAKVVKEEKLPADYIRLNSLVKVKELKSKAEMEFRIVMPALADIKAKKISVITPMGAALIGLNKGAKLEWKMPSGMKHFEILEVNQDLV